jgi:hypothetical protein
MFNDLSNDHRSQLSHLLCHIVMPAPMLDTARLAFVPACSFCQCISQNRGL